VPSCYRRQACALGRKTSSDPSSSASCKLQRRSGNEREGDPGPRGPSKKRPHRNGDPHVVLVNTLFWKILVTRVNRKMCRVEYGRNNVRALETRCPPPTPQNPHAREKINICSTRKIMPPPATRTTATRMSPAEQLPHE